MSRMKAHWPERLSPMLELRSAIMWLEMDLRSDDCDIYRCLGICEAINLMQWCIDAIHRESELHSARIRKRYAEDPNYKYNPFDEV